MMIGQAAVQVYLSMVATWYFNGYEKDQQEIEQFEERRRSTRDMKNALVGYDEEQE